MNASQGFQAISQTNKANAISKKTTTDVRPEMLETQAYMDENQSYFCKFSWTFYKLSGNSALSKLQACKFAL